MRSKIAFCSFLVGCVLGLAFTLPSARASGFVGGGGGAQTLAQTLTNGNTTGGKDISVSNGDALLFDNGLGDDLSPKIERNGTGLHLKLLRGDFAALVGSTFLAAAGNGDTPACVSYNGLLLSQTSPLTWSDSASANGTTALALQQHAAGILRICNDTAATTKYAKIGSGGVGLQAASAYAWAASTDATAAADTQFKRDAAGVVGVYGSGSNYGKLALASGVTVSSGSNSPEGAVTANVGALYLRTNGGASSTLYVKESGAGNTGWVAYGAVTYPLLASDGSASAPSYSFASETNTGLYRSAASTLAVSVSGTTAVTFAGNGTISCANGTNSERFGAGTLISNTTGTNNTALGTESLNKSTTGSSGSAVGYRALYSNTTGSSNTAVGNTAMNNNTTGNNNTAVGRDSLYTNSTGGNSTAVGHQALYSNTVSSNTAVGYQALYTNASGSGLAAFGYQALRNNTGSNNTASGYQALYTNTTGNNNTAVGSGALYTNNDGYYNSAVGYQSLNLNTSGVGNSAVGYQAMNNNTTGGYNTVAGMQALQANTTGSHNSAFGTVALNANVSGASNSAFGYSALQANTANSNSAFGHSSLKSNTTGGQNAAFGASALTSNTTGSSNVSVGLGSLGSNTTGSYNTAMGRDAGYSPAGTTANANTTGTKNTYLGYQTGASSSTQYDNQTTVGYQALGTASNQVVLGDLNVTQVRTFGSIAFANSTATVTWNSADTQIKNDSPGVVGVYASGSTYGTIRSGGLRLAIVSKTTAYTATAADHTILCDTSSAGFTVTLPAASSCTGIVYIIKKKSSDGNTLTIDGDGAETIDGAATQTITAQWASYTIQSDGTGWVIQ